MFTGKYARGGGTYSHASTRRSAAAGQHPQVSTRRSAFVPLLRTCAPRAAQAHVINGLTAACYEAVRADNTLDATHKTLRLDHLSQLACAAAAGPLPNALMGGDGGLGVFHRPGSGNTARGTTQEQPRQGR